MYKCSRQLLIQYIQNLPTLNDALVTSHINESRYGNEVAGLQPHSKFYHVISLWFVTQETRFCEYICLFIKCKCVSVLSYAHLPSLKMGCSIVVLFITHHNYTGRNIYRI